MRFTLSSIAVLVCIIPTISASLSDSVQHFHACPSCECFVNYHDRDISVEFGVSARALNAYDVTEEQCAMACLKDTTGCDAFVYGIEGGRDYFVCELYSTSLGLSPTTSPVYSPYLNTHFVRRAMPCMFDWRQNARDNNIVPLRNNRFTRDRDVLAKSKLRKERNERVQARMNEFYWGRK